MKKKLLATLSIDFIAPTYNNFIKLHYTQRATIKNQCLSIVSNNDKIKSLDLKYFKNFELEFDFELISKKRAYDIINYSCTIKMIEDSLVDLKVFKNDDNMNIVKHTINKPIKNKTLVNSKTIIKIFGEKK